MICDKLPQRLIIYISIFWYKSNQCFLFFFWGALIFISPFGRFYHILPRNESFQLLKFIYTLWKIMTKNVSLQKCHYWRWYKSFATVCGRTNQTMTTTCCSVSVPSLDWHSSPKQYMMPAKKQPTPPTSTATATRTLPASVALPPPSSSPTTTYMSTTPQRHAKSS